MLNENSRNGLIIAGPTDDYADLGYGSGALALAWTACGRLIGYIETHMNSWDCLAGLLLIREAGGFTNDFLALGGLHDGAPVIGGPLALKPALLAVASMDA